MILDGGKYHTLEELSEKCGLAEKTIYNLTAYGLVPKPRRGLIPGNPSKGVYPLTALERIRKILRLKADGLTMKEITATFESEGLLHA